MKKYFISEKCIHCGACKSDCPQNAIENFFINQEKCIHCGDCFSICPVAAVNCIAVESSDNLPLCKIF